MRPVLPANYLTELVHYPLPCKTSARNAVVPRWFGIASMRENGREEKVLKGAKVIVRFGQGWFLLFGDSGQEVMQNTPLVLRGMTAEEVTDMLRMAFNVHWAGEKGVKMDFQIGGRKIKNCKQNYTIPHAGNIFELVHTTVPYGEKTPGHAAGTNRREKNPQIATREERTTCTGTN